jgi:hypothetical protein
MASQTHTISINRDALVGVVFALLAAIGFSAKAILVKLAYLDSVDAVTLLALRMAFSVPSSSASRCGPGASMPNRSAATT